MYNACLLIVIVVICRYIYTCCQPSQENSDMLGFSPYTRNFAMHTIGLTLAESGLTGTVYGGAAVGGVVLVMISHALRWQYSKLVSLVISSVMNTVFIISLTAAVSEVRKNNDHSQNVIGLQRDMSPQIESAETQKQDIGMRV